ncbi:hypothetical protein A1D22_03435 [Pasteurellaceae bacterium LFhippo2]|nr:hypothetical protein [Pasteurellaceae bacterium LFhippo2]
MQKYDIHFCLVSAQAAANLLPILDSEFKPKEAIFLVSETMKKEAELLEKAFKAEKVKVTLFPISNEFDFETAENEIFEILTKFKPNTEIEDLNIALNLTGGTKVMAIAALNIFTMNGKPAFYVNTDEQSIVLLSQSGRSHSIALNPNLNLQNYLLGYGFDIQSQNKMISPSTDLFSDYFIQNYSKNWTLISKLNGYVRNTHKNIYRFTNEDEVITELYNFLYDVAEKKLISFNDELIDFKNKDTATLLGGAWLEHYLYKQIKGLDCINDIAMSIEISNPNYNKNKRAFDKDNLGQKNELDIAFIAKEKLHIIECKTVRMNEKGEEEKDDVIIYKLQALRNELGAKTKACLVSYRPISDSVRNRAKEANIKIIEGTEVQQIKRLIQEWIKQD